MRVLLYGVEKVGKSSFAAGAPGAIFVCPEDGLTSIDAPRFPEPTWWGEVLGSIEELRTGDHQYQNLVLDTLDWLEPLIWDHICQRDTKTDIEDYGYGKGYTAALAEWRRLVADLERLRKERGMGVILLAHSWIKSFKNPEGDDFDRYEMKLNLKAGGFIKEWCDAVLFANHETYAHQDDKKRVRGVSTGARLIHTERSAAWDAGNRYNLPAEMPLDWATFAAAVEANRTADPAVLRARITALLEGKDAAFCQRVQAAVTQRPDDAVYLARCLNKLAATLKTQEREQEQGT